MFWVQILFTGIEEDIDRAYVFKWKFKQLQRSILHSKDIPCFQFDAVYQRKCSIVTF